MHVSYVNGFVAAKDLLECVRRKLATIHDLTVLMPTCSLDR
jgi:hypothetical protein